LYCTNDSWIIAETCCKRSNWTKCRICTPNNNPRKQSTDENYSKYQSPEQEPFSGPLAHCLKNRSIDDSIIDTAHHLEQTQPQDSQDNTQQIHDLLKNDMCLYVLLDENKKVDKPI
jgi:hypothetical protein